MGFLLVVHVDVQPTGVNTCENRKSEGGGGVSIIHAISSFWCIFGKVKFSVN